MQVGTLFLRNPFGCWIDHLAACRPGLETDRRGTSSPSLLARNMWAAFERILETFSVVIREVQSDNGALSFAVPAENSSRSAAYCHAGHPAIQSQTKWLCPEWLRRVMSTHLAQGCSTKPPPS